jgi:hypothetical protein
MCVGQVGDGLGAGLLRIGMVGNRDVESQPLRNQRIVAGTELVGELTLGKDARMNWRNSSIRTSSSPSCSGAT